MLRVNWHDEELRVRLYTSLTGDIVKLGTTTEFPFASGGTNGAPSGWTPYFENGGVQSDVSFTTAMGRFSIGNVGTAIHHGGRYGVYRDFIVTANKSYLLQLQARTTGGRTKTIRYVEFATSASVNWVKLSQMWTYDDWENISLYITPGASTTIRVCMMAAPYTMDPKGMMTDVNWGIQFQNVSLTEYTPLSPLPTWHEITCDTKELSINYGRDKFTSRYNIATANVRVDNSSSYYTYGNGNADELRPGRFLRATLTLPGTTVEQPFYYGVIDSFTDTFDIDGSALVELSCIDTSSLVANMTVPTASSRDDIYYSYTRFREVLKAVGFNQNFYTSGSTQFSQQAIVANGRSVRDELGIIADSEGGWFFVDRNGVLTFRGRNWKPTTHTTVQAELIATPTREIPKVDEIPTVANVPIVELKGLGSDWTRDRIVNDVSISNMDGTALRYQDFESQRKYGPFTYQRLDFVNDNAGEPTYANARAADFMTGYADPILRVNSIQFNPVPETYLWAATVWLEDLVRVRYQHGNGWGWSVCTHVQGFRHTLTPKSWDMSIALDHPETFTYWEQKDGSGWDVSMWDVDIWDEWGIENGYWNSGEVWGDSIAYLDPTVGIASTPDPVTLPNEYIMVARVEGPIDTVYARMIAAQYPADPNASWYLRRWGTNGNLGMAITPDGTNASAKSIASETIPIVPGVPRTIAIAIQRDNGTGGTAAWTKYLDESTNTWKDGGNIAITQLNPFDSTGAVQIGQRGVNTYDRYDSPIYWVECRTGLYPDAGTVLWRFDPSDCPTGATSWTDPVSQKVWTVTNPAAIVPVAMPYPVATWGE